MSKRSVNVTETSLEFTDLEYNSEYSAYLTASTRFGDGNIKSDTITFRTSEGGKLIYMMNPYCHSALKFRQSHLS